MTPEEHRARHELLHTMLDELLADYINHNSRGIRNTTLLEFLDWSHSQTLHPTTLTAPAYAEAPELLAALQRAAAVLAHVENRFTARDPYQPTIRAATEQAYAAIARATLSPEAYAEAQAAAGDVAEAAEERKE